MPALPPSAPNSLQGSGKDTERPILQKSARRLPGVVIAALLLSHPAGALVPPRDSPDERFFTAPALEVKPSLARLEREAAAASHPEVAGFLARHPGSWEVFWDARSDDPALIQGQGIPLLPGRGNPLRAGDLGLSPSEPPSLAQVESLLRRLLAAEPGLFSVPLAELVLDPQRSGNAGRERQIWSLELQQHRGGIPVVGAAILARVVHGNLVQLGAERVAPIAGLAVEPQISRDEAVERAWQAAGLAAGSGFELIEPPRLEIHPLLPDGERPGFRYQGPAGNGYRHALAWRVVFRRAGERTTFQALVDASGGRLLQLIDLNRYATVSGGIYPETYLQPEVVVNFPFARVDIDSQVTDSEGNYPRASTQLDGQFFKSIDACGPIDLQSSSTGDLALGTSSGDNCATPGFGGAGNTHAARTSFYTLTSLNRMSAPYTPSNSPGDAWLSSKLTVHTNMADYTCNALWAYGLSELFFYQSGGGCGNSGELAGPIAHEWGHGFDEATGGLDDPGTMEAVGDVFALLYNHNSCIGPGFHSNGRKCHNCTSCTGVRDLSDFAFSGPRAIASPAKVADPGGIACARYPCDIPGDAGVMGYEAHCESYIASTAVFDLAMNLMFGYGTDDGWEALEKIWYASLVPSQDAYHLADGGTCNPQAIVDGCAPTNFYQVFLAADDDDGNLANGTPDACCIWDALAAHGIACGARPGCGSGCQGFGFAPDKLAGRQNAATTVDLDGQGQWMADVTGDGRADYVYNRDATKEYWVMVAKTNNSGTFNPDKRAGSRDYDVGWGGKGQWMADVTGDGRADYVYNRNDTKEYRVMRASDTFNLGTFQADQPAGSRNSNNGVGWGGNAQWMADVTGDRRADYVYNRNDTKEYWVMRASAAKPGTFLADQLAGSRNVDNSVGWDGRGQWMADVNGDGRADYVYNRANTKEYWVMLASASDPATFETDKLAGSRINADVAWDGLGQWLADVNGDGRADYVYNRAATNEYWVMLAKPDGTFATDRKAGSRNSGNVVGWAGKGQWMADVNGDGRADYIYNRDPTREYWVMLGNGAGLFETDRLAGSRNSSNSVGWGGLGQWMADVNGDGCADYLYNHDENDDYWVLLALCGPRP